MMPSPSVSVAVGLESPVPEPAVIFWISAPVVRLMTKSTELGVPLYPLPMIAA
jgi:hypothetical protein